jgi:hypothetical protein
MTSSTQSLDLVATPPAALSMAAAFCRFSSVWLSLGPAAAEGTGLTHLYVSLVEFRLPRATKNSSGTWSFSGAVYSSCVQDVVDDAVLRGNLV